MSTDDTAEAAPEGIHPRWLLAFMRWAKDHEAELDQLGEGGKLDKIKALKLAFFAGIEWQRG